MYSWGHKPAVRDLRSVNAQLLAKEGWANTGRCCFWACVLVSAQWPVLQRNCPKFLILELKVVFAAFSVWIWQCRTGAAETQLSAFPGFNPAALGSLSCEKPRLTLGHLCVPNFFSFWRLLWVILVGKRSGWFQENFVENHMKLHCSKNPHGWFTLLSDSLLKSNNSQTGVFEFTCCLTSKPVMVTTFNCKK